MLKSLEMLKALEGLKALEVLKALAVPKATGLSFKYLAEEMVLEALSNRPAQQSVVVTGRGGGAALANWADTVSEVKEIKHAYNQGIMARKGVDL